MLVYKLYGLSYEEILMVNERFHLTREEYSA